MQKFTYVIGYNLYDPNCGGSLVLSYLCHLLNELNEKCYMIETKSYNPLNLNCPIKPKDLNVDSDKVIVIYPEVVLGNPYKAKNVARWILFKVGVNGGDANLHGSNDLIFGFKKEFSFDKCIITDTNTVRIFYVMDDIYYNVNKEPRNKTCVMIRKGDKYHKKFDKHPSDAIIIERGTSHSEIAKIFNQCHTFYCYDPYTAYSKYAVLCGCNSIVIPNDSISYKDWHYNPEDRFGVAYGIEDVERAQKTKPLMVERIKNQKKLNILNVQKFINLCESHF